MNSFKTTAHIFLISMLFAACTENVGMPEPGDVEKATLRVTLNFEGAGAETKAAPGSTAIPKTSWAIIQHIQFFLLNKPDNKVVYSYASTINPRYGTGGTVYDKGEFVLTGIPVGDYKLVVLGNVLSRQGYFKTSYLTSIDGSRTETIWDSWNVRGKNAETDLLISNAPMPSLLMTPMPPSLVTADLSYYRSFLSSGNLDLFKGTADVSIAVGSNRIVSPIPFTRQFSLMRMRFNFNTAKYGRDFKSLKDLRYGIGPNLTAILLLFRIPKDFNMITGPNPMTVTDKEALYLGVYAPSSLSLTSYEPGGTFGLSTNNEGFTHVSDIMVFPNNTGDSVEDDRRYFIVLCQFVNKGHVLANGEKTPGLMTLPGAASYPVDMVYWSAMINAPFKANEIREVNLTLVTGGSLDFPERTDDSSMNIIISKPQPWTVTDISHELK